MPRFEIVNVPIYNDLFVTQMEQDLLPLTSSSLSLSFPLLALSLNWESSWLIAERPLNRQIILVRDRQGRESFLVYLLIDIVHNWCQQNTGISGDGNIDIYCFISKRKMMELRREDSTEFITVEWICPSRHCSSPAVSCKPMLRLWWWNHSL